MAARGTVVMYDEFSESIADGRIDLDTDTFKAAWVTVAAGTTPVINTAAVPCWGAGGSTNVSSSEVTPGGGYSAGGVALTSVTWGQSGGTATFDSADFGWTSAASGDFTDGKTVVIYSDTATNKDCVCYIEGTVDAGTTPVSLLAGDISCATPSGFFTLG